MSNFRFGKPNDEEYMFMKDEDKILLTEDEIVYAFKTLLQMNDLKKEDSEWFYRWFCIRSGRNP